MLKDRKQIHVCLERGAEKGEITRKLSGGMEVLATLSGDSFNRGGGGATQQAAHFKQHSSLYSNSTQLSYKNNVNISGCTAIFFKGQGELFSE